MSKYTKKSLVTLWILRLIDFVIVAGPITVYVIYALCNSDTPQYGKLTIIGMIGIAAIIGLVNLLFQKRLRSPIWLIFIGLYVAMNKLLDVVLIVAICSILDEMIIAPLIDKYKIKYEANKVMDARQ